MRTILVFDEIGWGGITGEMIARELDFANGDDVELRVNSPGGDVFEGVAIYNMLRNYSGNVRVVVDGLAASIASIIALGGDEIVMNQGSFFMIHNPWSGAMGEANDFRKQADVLDSIRDQLLGIYQKATGMDEEEIIAMMDAETWLTAEQAIEMGFATSQESFTKVAASLKTKYLFNNIPTELKQMSEKQEVIHNEVAEAELDEVLVEETALEEQEIEAEESEEFEELEFVAEAELEEELEDESEFEEEVEEILAESEEIIYSQVEVELLIEEALQVEAERQSEIKSLALDGQEELVEELIKDRVEIAQAAKRLLVNAKELKLGAKREDLNKNELLNKINEAAPKSLDSKKEEKLDIDQLRAKAAKASTAAERAEINREIIALKKSK